MNQVTSSTADSETTRVARLLLASKQIEFARKYTMTLLDGLSEEQWYFVPGGMITHIAWQVGHIAMAQYGLTLFRQRGRQDIDGELMSSKFRKLFMKGTQPEANRDAYPSRDEIMQVLQRVEQQMLIELPNFSAEQLDEPTDPPHMAFANKYGALLFASHHEMLHAGQIGMLRRMMGLAPVR
jgi:DinB superfamily